MTRTPAPTSREEDRRAELDAATMRLIQLMARAAAAEVVDGTQEGARDDEEEDHGSARGDADDGQAGC